MIRDEGDQTPAVFISSLNDIEDVSAGLKVGQMITLKNLLS